MPDWIRKPLTTAHPIMAVLSDKNGPLDLPSGSTVTMRVKIPGTSTLLLNVSATIISPGALVGDPDRGKVSYTPQSGDLVPGIYEVDFLATIPGLGVVPVPESDYMYMLVEEGADSV